MPWCRVVRGRCTCVGPRAANPVGPTAPTTVGSAAAAAAVAAGCQSGPIDRRAGPEGNLWPSANPATLPDHYCQAELIASRELRRRRPSLHGGVSPPNPPSTADFPAADRHSTT